jgi:hypothetical protein
MEARANTIGLEQSLEAFNWISSSYETIHTQVVSLKDSVAQIDVSANIAQYVQPGSGAVRLRAGWRPVGPVFLFPWTICIDQVAVSIE